MLQHRRKESIFIMLYQRKLIFGYVTLIPVQNELRPSACESLWVLKHNSEGVMFTRYGRERAGGLYELTQLSRLIMQYLEILKYS